MSCIADLLVDTAEKILDRLNLDNVDDDTWENIQDWIMKFAETQEKAKTLDVNFLVDEFIKMNVCNHCQKITFNNCSCKRM